MAFPNVKTWYVTNEAKQNYQYANNCLTKFTKKKKKNG